MFALLPNHYLLSGTGQSGEGESRNERGSAIEGGMHNVLDKREQLQTNTEIRRKTTYPTVLSDRQWEAAQRVIPAEYQIGRPRTTDLRQVVNALCYMQATQCSWRTLPDHFPDWQTVCTYLYRWQRLGVWKTICEAISSAEV